MFRGNNTRIVGIRRSLVWKEFAVILSIVRVLSSRRRFTWRDHLCRRWDRRRDLWHAEGALGCVVAFGCDPVSRTAHFRLVHISLRNRNRVCELDFLWRSTWDSSVETFAVKTKHQF